MKDKLILKDNTIINLEAGASISSMVTNCADWMDVATMMQKLTGDNLSDIQVQNGEGLTVGHYTDMVLQPGGWEVHENGIHITISIREKTDIEKAINILQEGQAVQDGAIEDLAAVTSTLAGGVRA